MADSNNNSRQQHIVNTVPILNNISPSSNNMVNIQLSYNIDQALDPDIIRRVCEQTLAKIRISRHRTVVILLVYNGGRTRDLKVM